MPVFPSIATIGVIVRETGMVCAPHLTCVGAPRGEVLEIAAEYWEMGIRRIVALRGDPPLGDGATRYYRISAFTPDGRLSANVSEAVVGTTAPLDLDAMLRKHIYILGTSGSGKS